MNNNCGEEVSPRGWNSPSDLGRMMDRELRGQNPHTTSYTPANPGISKIF